MPYISFLTTKLICFQFLLARTSSTVHTAVLPAAMSPQVEVFRFFRSLDAALLRLVQRHCVLVVDTICLIVEQENLG